MTEEVRRLFVELADLGPEARQRVYRNGRAGGIRREVESLLGFDGGGESFTGEVALAAAEFANAGELRERRCAPAADCAPTRLSESLAGAEWEWLLARRVGREDSGWWR
ncbi:MAG: hypothetical protein U5J83_02065 [Bryobacterales bacterium]|nr:hypothetical protein [Bryobacterales bacterium]